MSLTTELRRRGGIARSASLIEAGYSPYRIRQALRFGSLQRPRRGWIALPDVDPELRYAAQHGVILSCITQARRLGLWVLRSDGDARHVVARHPGAHVDASIGVIHWNRPLLRLPPDALVDPIENVLATVARCQPWDSALAVLDSALNKGLLTIPTLEQLPLPQALRALVKHSSPWADSGLETLFRSRLKWLRIPIRPQTWILGHRVDFLLGQRLVVQLDGGSHEGAQRTSDNRHDAALQRAGYHVIRVSYEQVVHCWEEVQQMILDAVARGHHLTLSRAAS